MTTIQLEQFIHASAEAVYDYVTRPALWKEWHPASQGADGHAAESLGVGALFPAKAGIQGASRPLSNSSCPRRRASSFAFTRTNTTRSPRVRGEAARIEGVHEPFNLVILSTTNDLVPYA